MGVSGGRIDPAERRIFAVGILAALAGVILCESLFGLRPAISLLSGALLSALNLLWLRAIVSGLVFADRRGSKRRVLTGFILRLLLTPLILYVMLRTLYVSLPAAAAGYALVHCGILFEGIREACSARPKDNARDQ